MIVTLALWFLCLLFIAFAFVFGSFVRRNPFLWTLMKTSVKFWVVAKWESTLSWWNGDKEAELVSDDETSQSSESSEGGVHVLGVQHFDSFTVVFYTYRDLQYKMVFGAESCEQITQESGVHYTDADYATIVQDRLSEQEAHADIVLRVDNCEGINKELEQWVVELFGPFAALPDTAGLLECLAEHFVGAPDLWVTCLDCKYFISPSSRSVDKLPTPKDEAM